jgi:aspartate racemase
VHFVDELPLTRVGKVDRAALATLAATEPEGSAFEAGAGDEAQVSLVDIWSRVLRRRVGVDEDFFEELGGTSLDALEIMSGISRTTGRSFPLSLLLELNTVRKMSEYLAASSGRERTVIALQREGTLPPLFCVSGKGGSVIVFRALADALGREQPFFGLTHHGLDAAKLPSTLAAVAACYADAIREVQSDGPYFLAGYSAGGCIAFEIARQMTRAGHAVAFVGLIDTVAARESAPLPKRLGKYVSLFRRDPAGFLGRSTLAVAHRVQWTAKWAASGGKAPFGPQLPPDRNRFYDSLNLQASLRPYSGPVTLFLAR